MVEKIQYGMTPMNLEKMESIETKSKKIKIRKIHYMKMWARNSDKLLICENLSCVFESICQRKFDP
jgi:hypothetical protein